MLDNRTWGPVAWTSASQRMVYLGTGGHRTANDDATFRDDLRARFFDFHFGREATRIDGEEPIRPTKRKLSFRASKSKGGPSGVVEAAFGSAGEPTSADSSGGGATLTLYRMGGSPDDVHTYTLPAAF